MIQNGIEFYKQQGVMTDPRHHAARYLDLPDDVNALVDTVEGLVVHIFWAEGQGLALDDQRKAEVGLRAAWQKLDRLFELDPAPLTQPRPRERKLVCNCRDYTTLLVSFLRFKGYAARSRCGFATYFIPGHFEDHWVAEVWNEREQRWQMVDAQLNPFMREALKLDFNPRDMPVGKFVTAGEGWQMCRRQEADPGNFGIQQWSGWPFIYGDLVRDFLALNRIEILPWDGWDAVWMNLDDPASKDWTEVDALANLTVHAGERTPEVLDYYANQERFHPPFLSEY